LHGKSKNETLQEERFEIHEFRLRRHGGGRSFSPRKDSCPIRIPAATYGVSETGKSIGSLRLNRFEGERIAIALAISLGAHLFAFGGYEFGKETHVAKWLHKIFATAKQPPKPVQTFEEPLEFVTVAQPSTEAPKNAKYYSSQNSKAANPDAEQDTANPKLNGKQPDVAKTEDATHQNFAALQPAPPSQAQPKPATTPGDLILGKPQNAKQQEQQQRPRTIQQALAQKNLPGPQMKQNGGTHEKQLVASFDAKATPFGAYDQRIVEAVTQRWYDLLDSRNFAQDRVGKVTVRFHLNYDGSVSDMQILSSSVGDLFSLVCRNAVEQAAPFGAWPSDMRRMVAMNYREITFTFYYY
jgi:outer membrane biosynthesis protein TonB